MQESLTSAQVDALTPKQQVERYGKYASPDGTIHLHRQRFYREHNKVMKPHMKRWVNDSFVKTNRGKSAKQRAVKIVERSERAQFASAEKAT